MNVRRQSLQLSPDPRRVLLRPFLPSLVIKPTQAPEANARILAIFVRVLLLDERAAEAKLEEVLADFCGRHHDLRQILMARFEQIVHLLPVDRKISETRKLLIGSYFINEYSLESSALFNPSIVAAPDQTGLEDGHLRVIISLRATGEGHISSITFRSGIIAPDGQVRIDPVSRFVHAPSPEPAARYDLSTFRRKLYELGVEREAADAALADLPAKFSMGDLIARIGRLRRQTAAPDILRAAERAAMLAEANYTVSFADGLDISEKIIFPFSPNESNGIEDARFVRFVEDDGSVTYYATYTAYNGSVVFPQMVETRDFREFALCTLNGPAVRNKGLALFPRRIDGHYAMLGRQDSENIHLMFSDHLHFWHDSKVIVRPAEPWEFIQLGNCGSPIETEAGWLVLTHGVGPMRKYCIGAILLDLHDPARVIGRLREPLLGPAPDEREGYVPNVVYSCGGIIHRGNLILPYAVSDTATRFATVNLNELLEELSRGL